MEFSCGTCKVVFRDNRRTLWQQSELLIEGGDEEFLEGAPTTLPKIRLFRLQVTREQTDHARNALLRALRPVVTIVKICWYYSALQDRVIHSNPSFQGRILHSNPCTSSFGQLSSFFAFCTYCLYPASTQKGRKDGCRKERWGHTGMQSFCRARFLGSEW